MNFLTFLLLLNGSSYMNMFGVEAGAEARISGKTLSRKRTPNAYNVNDAEPYLAKLARISGQNRSPKRTPNTYNLKDAESYLSKIRPKPRSRFLNAEKEAAKLAAKQDPAAKQDETAKQAAKQAAKEAANTRQNNKDKEKDMKDKEKDKDKNSPMTPAPSISFAPTKNPTLYPTRAPVQVPWIHTMVGNVELKVSLFAYDTSNGDSDENGANRNLGLGIGIGQTLIQKNVYQYRINYQTRKLERLKSSDILAKSNSDLNLIPYVISSMAQILCESTLANIKILSVVDGQFYDYCSMLDSQEMMEWGNSMDNNNTDTNNENANTENSEIDMDDFLTRSDLLSSIHTYLVTDFEDDETGLLNIDDKNVYDGSTGGYLDWTSWSVRYPVMQFGNLDSLNGVETDSDSAFDMGGNGNGEGNGNGNGNFNGNGNGNFNNGNQNPNNPNNSNNALLATEEDVQKKADQIFATAVADGLMNDIIQEKAMKEATPDDNLYVTSVQGNELTTFGAVMKQFESEDNGEGEGTGTGTGTGANNGDGEGSEDGSNLNNSENPIVAIKEPFWQPIRITGLVLLLTLTLTVALLMKVGHERYNHDVWDATVNNKDNDGLDVNLVTYEGVNFMLEHGHQMRKEDESVPTKKSKRGMGRGRGSGEDLQMDMGNTLSEIAGERVGGSSIMGGNSNSSSRRGASESPVNVPAVKKLFYNKLGWRTQDDDDEENEALALDQSFQPVNTTTDAEVGGRRKGKDSSSRFPVQNSLDGPSAEDILLGCSNPARKEHELANDALKFPKDPRTPPKSSRRKVRLMGGRRKDLKTPSTPDNAERVQGQGDDFVFIAVNSKH